MIKRLKLIFYITSAVILGLATIWQIYSVRGVLISANGKQLDDEINQVQDVVRLWAKREAFNAGSIDKPATPSSARTTPTPELTEDKPASSTADKDATPSAEN